MVILVFKASFKFARRGVQANTCSSDYFEALSHRRNRQKGEPTRDACDKGTLCLLW